MLTYSHNINLSTQLKDGLQVWAWCPSRWQRRQRVALMHAAATCSVWRQLKHWPTRSTDSWRWGWGGRAGGAEQATFRHCLHLVTVCQSSAGSYDWRCWDERPWPLWARWASAMRPRGPSLGASPASGAQWTSERGGGCWRFLCSSISARNYQCSSSLRVFSRNYIYIFPREEGSLSYLRLTLGVTPMSTTRLYRGYVNWG
jgi:hypothetical protein